MVRFGMTVRVEVNGRPLTEYLLCTAGWTLEEFLARAPENAYWEFVRGEVIMHSPVAAEHQRMVRFLLGLLQGFCEAREWGEVLMGPAALQVLPEVIREPDLSVLDPEEARRAQGVPLQVRPVLVVEVTSPATRTLDLEDKAREYAQAGIPEYWVVDRERKDLWLHRRKEGHEHYQVTRQTFGVVVSQGVPGFWLQTEWLWEQPLPPVRRCLERILHHPPKDLQEVVS